MSKHDENAFGGKNPQGLYVPMSEVEQEVLQRLVDEEMMEVLVHGWGVVPVEKGAVILGDKRVAIKLQINFQTDMELFFLDLELRLRDGGQTLIRKTEHTLVNGGPYRGRAGEALPFNWDIAIDFMDPDLVKAIKPGAVGLTSRRLDKDTHEPTIEGNMDLDSERRNTLHLMEQQAAKVRQDDVVQSTKAAQRARVPVKMTDKGPSMPDLD